MYPQVVQFETRRLQVARELQLTRERRTARGGPKTALQGRSTTSTPREPIALCVNEVGHEHDRAAARKGDNEPCHGLGGRLPSR